MSLGAPGVSGDVRLRVTDLRIERTSDGADIVDHVAFELRATEVLGLVGESGSGKSTVALAMLAHARHGLRISRGAIVLDGEDILRLDTGALREARGRLVSYVPQDPASALNPAMRVGAQVAEALRVHDRFAETAQARTLEVLDEVRLPSTPDFLRKFPHQLSGGQQQRVAIAMAFACRPSLIVLDEPTTGLDVSTQRHVLDTVRRLCERYEAAAIFVTHDLAVVSNLATRVAVMYAGRLVELGATTGIFSAPRHPYTRGLLASIPRIERAEPLPTIPGRAPRPGERPEGCSFAPRCPLATAQCESDPPLTDVDGVAARCWHAGEAGPDRADSVLTKVRLTGDEDPILQAENISASYGELTVLHDVSFTLPRGLCTAIVGESGSGKTTLARCLVGLHSNYTGTATLDGSPLARDCRKRSKADLRRVQYVFQNPYNSLNPRKTIGQIIEQALLNFSTCSKAERRARVDQALADVSLDASLTRRYPDELSGGERQRVAIARALAAEPDVLICDEITSALDVSVQSVVVELLRGLQRERGITIGFITHNLALVRAIAQNVVVISQGRIVEAGSVETVLTCPQDAYTVRLLEDVPRLLTTSPGPSPANAARASA